ncbi:hypothetical protein RDWZM_001687 [Blomia tropicalis]|uniref:SNTX MACPF/CDC-like domain-containing protein n=1 Tax=Blomia tropicalis TaxID=40697 RepID=A0A9Q0MF25_BLOTA|nr:hypothetical protein RDWZM_001687 [Blomia tropicalis]
MNYFSMTNLFISTIFIVFCWNEAVSEKSVQANVDECDFYDTCYPVNPIEIEAIGRVSNLGGLYDSRSNQFISVSLFEQPLTNSSIISTSNKHTKLEYTLMDTLSEKFRVMDISGELKVSILSGLFKLQGSGRYFKDTKKSYKSAKASLIQSISTEYEEISITDKNIKTLVNMDVLEQIDATHVVVGIQWGGKVLISVEDTNSENIEKKKLKET